MVQIYDLADPTELQGFVRNVDVPTYQLVNWLAPDNIDDIEYRITRGTLIEQDMAPFRAFDTEAPIGNRPGFSSLRGELPPISKKMPLGEEQRLRLKQLSGGGNVRDAIIAAIFDDTETTAKSLLARFEMARGQALYTGKVTIAENGVAAEVDYGYVPAQFRTSDDKNADGTGGDGYFSDPSYKAIEQLTVWADEYEARAGVRPEVMLTSRKVKNALLRNTQIATLAATQAGTPALVTGATLDAVLGAFELPVIRTYEATVRTGGVATRVIPQNLGLYLPATGAQLGRTLFGVTAEALELVEARQIKADQAPGMTAVVDKTFDPVSLWTKVSAIGLPAIFNPELVSVLTLLAP